MHRQLLLFALIKCAELNENLKYSLDRGENILPFQLRGLMTKIVALLIYQHEAFVSKCAYMALAVDTVDPAQSPGGPTPSIK
jgi:hypothetical protein